MPGPSITGAAPEPKTQAQKEILNMDLKALKAFMLSDDFNNTKDPKILQSILNNKHFNALTNITRDNLLRDKYLDLLTQHTQYDKLSDDEKGKVQNALGTRGLSEGSVQLGKQMMGASGKPGEMYGSIILLWLKLFLDLFKKRKKTPPKPAADAEITSTEGEAPGVVIEKSVTKGKGFTARPRQSISQDAQAKYSKVIDQLNTKFSRHPTEGEQNTMRLKEGENIGAQQQTGQNKNMVTGFQNYQKVQKKQLNLQGTPSVSPVISSASRSSSKPGGTSLRR